MTLFWLVDSNWTSCSSISLSDSYDMVCCSYHHGGGEIVMIDYDLVDQISDNQIIK